MFLISKVCRLILLKYNLGEASKQTRDIWPGCYVDMNWVIEGKIIIVIIISSDRSSYRDSGLLLVQQLFQILSISANIHSFFFLQIECRLIIIDSGHLFLSFSLFFSLFLSFSLYISISLYFSLFSLFFSLFSLFFSLFLSFISLLLSFFSLLLSFLSCFLSCFLSFSSLFLSWLPFVGEYLRSFSGHSTLTGR